jgi:hypothetical protein
VWRAILPLAALILAGPDLAYAVDPPSLAPLAHSSLLELEGAPTASGLSLRVRPVSAQPPLTISEIAVTLDGKPQTVTARADGGFEVALTPSARRGAGQLEVTVAHDGLREVLSARVPLGGGASAPAAPETSASRKQMWWWLLNIAIVLIAALAISRRMS